MSPATDLFLIATGLAMLALATFVLRQQRQIERLLADIRDQLGAIRNLSNHSNPPQILTRDPKFPH